MGMLMMLEILFALDKSELFLMIKDWFCATDTKQTFISSSAAAAFHIDAGLF